MSAVFSRAIEKRLHLKHLIDSKETDKGDGTDAIAGLSAKQKSLPPRYFYDDRGSQLFERICELPEYYPTRTETAILQEYASVVARMTGACELVELGSGNSTKTRLLLDAYQHSENSLLYVPIDVSAGILKKSALQLLADYPSLEINALVGTYEQALEQLPPSSLPKRMVFFLGSTIGNFSPAECDRFFTHIKVALSEGDYFLLGIDLQKPIDILEAAYNDTQGVTAAFNLNVLQHLNWRFQGNFDLSLFQHQAFYNPSECQIEMHLKVLQSHRVFLKALDLKVNLEAGETIMTEISRKFALRQMANYLQTRGLKTLQVWTDPNNWFALLLCEVSFK